MTLFTRSAVVAIALAAPLSLAHAQTAQDQDHTAHHPAGQTAQQTQPGSTPQPMPQGRMARPGAMPQGKAGGMPMMGGDMGQMMQMMRGMMVMDGMMAMDGMMPMGGPGRMQPFAHIEGQLAFYKTELKITEAQASQWNAFADAVRAGAQKLQDAFAGAMQSSGPASAIDQADRRIKLLSARLDALKAIAEATKPLYAALSDDQKKTADELMAEHLRGM